MRPASVAAAAPISLCQALGRAAHSCSAPSTTEVHGSHVISDLDTTATTESGDQAAWVVHSWATSLPCFMPHSELPQNEAPSDGWDGEALLQQGHAQDLAVASHGGKVAAQSCSQHERLAVKQLCQRRQQQHSTVCLSTMYSLPLQSAESITCSMCSRSHTKTF